MSALVVGLSHRSAPVPLLERAARGAEDTAGLLRTLLSSEPVAEAMLLATCNRVEVYASVERFHAAVQAVTELLAAAADVPAAELHEHLYVHYEDRAVQHLFSVACGLDSMVVGETQILGQLRSAYLTARGESALGRQLDPLVQHALRVGKRAHTETGIDKAGHSLVSVGLSAGAGTIGGFEGRVALLVGAGSMSSLAAAELRRMGVAELHVANRTRAHAERLARSVTGRAHTLDRLAPLLAEADVVVASTGATGIVLSAEVVREALHDRPEGRPLFVLDLALPRDVDPAVRDLPGVTLLDLESLREILELAQVSRDVDDVRRIVTEEVATHLTRLRSARVAPTVVALRSKAQQVVDAELERLYARLPDADERVRHEVAETVRRVVDKLLHAPTVRVKELAAGPGGDTYAEALRELFELDPAAPQAVAQADVTLPLPGRARDAG